ncbi:MAG TPA: hypothetical protein DD655_04655 [Halieaceae bacterium]|nr:MAG: Uncharacterised protein [Halieaceae bacterium]HBQ02896.1 hypothetical protein [Halieaceae bacterium]HCJ38817.1 hypothetical protein [Halieaceae bacterium]
MVERLLGSMTLGLSAKRLAALFILLFVVACTSREVVVEGAFPTPLIDPVPVSVGILFTQEFREHELIDDATGRGEVSWRVSTGSAQVDFWSTLFPAFFQNVVFINSYEDLETYDVDAVLIPEVSEVQYAIPLYTSVKVYEIWMRYQLSLVEPEQIMDADNKTINLENMQAFAEWPLTAYGKTPTAFMQSDVDAVNLAAVMALRDAGANFITSFARVPGVMDWIENPEVAQ